MQRQVHEKLYIRQKNVSHTSVVSPKKNYLHINFVQELTEEDRTTNFFEIMTNMLNPNEINITTIPLSDE